QDVVAFGLGPLQAGDPVTRRGDGIAFRLEPAADEAADAFVVLHQQQLHQAATRSATASGKYKVATVPPPGRGVSSVRPPWACTSAWTRLSPRPDPSPRVSPRWKRSNKRLARAKSSPGPSSLTENETPSALLRASIVTATPRWQWRSEFSIRAASARRNRSRSTE